MQIACSFQNITNCLNCDPGAAQYRDNKKKGDEETLN